MKIVVGMVALLSVGMVHGLTQEGESYQANPGIRCLGHDIKRHTADIKGCQEACDLLPDCVEFVHSDDGSRGYCNLKKDSCLTFINRKPGLTMFIKPKKVPFFYHIPMDKIEGGKILGGINGTLRNGPILFNGKKGKALHFSSQSAEYGLIPCFSDLEQCGDAGYSTAMWLRVDDLQGVRYILSSGGQTGQSRAGGIAVVIKNFKLQVEIRSWAVKKAWISSGLTVSTGWFHLAVVWDGSVMKIYQNGELKETVQASSTKWGQLSYENRMYLGRPNNGEVYYGIFAIDEWYYWNNLLSDKEIRNVYTLDK